MGCNLFSLDPPIIEAVGGVQIALEKAVKSKK